MVQLFLWKKTVTGLAHIMRSSCFLCVDQGLASSLFHQSNTWQANRSHSRMQGNSIELWTVLNVALLAGTISRATQEQLRKLQGKQLNTRPRPQTLVLGHGETVSWPLEFVGFHFNLCRTMKDTYWIGKINVYCWPILLPLQAKHLLKWWMSQEMRNQEFWQKNSPCSF